MEDEKILEEIRGQNKKIMEYVAEQNKNSSVIIGKLEEHDGQFDKINGRFDRLEAAVSENSDKTNDVKNTLNKIDQKIDIAVTNHEQRIRKVETKIGI